MIRKMLCINNERMKFSMTMQIIRVFISSIEQYIIKLRHVDVHRHWLMQEIQADKINIQWTSLTKTIADELIKSLRSQKHLEFIKLLDLKNVSVNSINQTVFPANQKTDN
jgi:hypothetical protein